jgi:dihydropyrimidinase
VSRVEPDGLDLVVRGGRVVTSRDEGRVDVGVAGGRIAAIGDGLRGSRTIDADGLLVLPGAVDGHVHLRTEDAELRYDDTFETGSIAAAHGGVTTIVDQAQVSPGTTLSEGVDRRLREAEGRCLIDYGLHVNLREAGRERAAEIPTLARRGFPSFKLFMAYDGYRLDDVALLVALQHIAAAGGLAIIHAENGPVIDELLRQQEAAGRHGPAWRAGARPAALEGEAVHRALVLASIAGARCLVFHLSAAQGVDALRQARDRGQEAGGEACLHHLVLDERLLEHPQRGSGLDVAPPLRGQADRDALWAALRDGTIEVVSSDHGPRRRRPGAGGHLVVPPGTSGVEVRLALVHELGVRTGALTPSAWVAACCTAPAETFGLPTKGDIRLGADADLVLFDPSRTVTLDAASLHSAIDHATYEDLTVTGFPVTTIARGEVVVDDGRLVADPGRGRLAPRGWQQASSGGVS